MTLTELEKELPPEIEEGLEDLVGDVEGLVTLMRVFSFYAPCLSEVDSVIDPDAVQH